MSDQRRKPGQAIATQQPIAAAKTLKDTTVYALAWLSLASSVLVMGGTGVYVDHLHQESTEAKRAADHLEISQEVLIKDRDLFAARVLDLEAEVEQLEQRAKAEKKHAGILLQGEQDLKDENLLLTKNVTAAKPPYDQQRWADGDLEQTIAQKDAHIQELSAEIADLRVKMYELANAVAISQATSNARTAELVMQEDENG